MKKLLSLMLALVLCMGCCAAFAETAAAANAAFVGYWELESMSLFGISLDKADLDYTVVVNIHEDDTMLLAMEDTFAVTTLTYADGACTAAMGEGEPMPLSIDAEGKLNMTMTGEGMSMDLKLARSTVPALDAAFAPYIGEWNLDHVSLMGMTLTAEDMGQSDLIAYEDGYGALVMEGEIMAFQLQNADGVVSMYDTDGMTYPMTISENGQLCFSITVEGLTMDVVMNRVGAVAEAAPEAEETAAEQPAVVYAAGDYNGKWVGESVELMGMTFTMEELEMSISMEIIDDYAMLAFGEDSGLCTVTYDDAGCIINDGVTDSRGYFNEAGQLCLELQAEGLTMVVKMVPQAE